MCCSTLTLKRQKGEEMSKIGRMIAEKAKRAAAVGLAGCLLLGVSGQVSAATLKDVFDEHYHVAGSYTVSEYDENEREIKTTFYHTDGSYSVSEYNRDGKIVKSTRYDADGNIITE